MEFQSKHKSFFNCEKGAFSIVTARETKDSQITANKEEKEIILNYFGEENIWHGNMTTNPEKSLKEFLLYPGLEPISLNLVFPKPEKSELRLYLSSKNNFKPKGGDIWFVFVNKSDNLVIGSMDKVEWNNIQGETFYEDLKEFIEVSKIQVTGKGTTPEAKLFNQQRLKEYKGLKVDVSFGQGRATATPWISFLGSQQKTSNGIYPVYLFFKEKNILILAFGISETYRPLLTWDIGETQSVTEFFTAKDSGDPKNYGSSYVFKTYDTTKPLNANKIDEDLSQIIGIYKKVLEGLSDLENMTILDFNYKTFHQKTKEAGLLFSEKIVSRFVASLFTKPFVICSGLSGSGKTKLAQSFVKWICKSEEQYKIVPVGADWTNREPLLGFPNGLDPDKYVFPDSGVLQLIINAGKSENKNKPYFLILDEMNLSHVERYFADFLSIMESQDTIKLYSGSDRLGPDNLKIGSEISWPENLFIIGTVNIDETTYMFSPKVLDRANVIEFRISESEISEYLAAPGKPDMSKFINQASKQGYAQQCQKIFWIGPKKTQPVLFRHRIS
jgi:hypothetical protein